MASASESAAKASPSIACAAEEREEAHAPEAFSIAEASSEPGKQPLTEARSGVADTKAERPETRWEMPW